MAVSGLARSGALRDCLGAEGAIACPQAFAPLARLGAWGDRPNVFPKLLKAPPSVAI
ncbi:hypothetical protein [Geitlerinema sp. PCC 7407]|uniref:hypothetical protein n=1 Tax=Geitlerinema sp. PCC 7407 TaxID=1173025 RepID=UPI00030AA71D|nr:hypothetical protein [Geitlerinema sp. PCC 7407]